MKNQIDTLDQLYEAFDGLSVEGGWHRRTPSLWPEPRKTMHPFMWTYESVKPILDAAGHLVSTEFAERRNLTMTNPMEGNIYSTVRTMVAAYQMIKPGETAASHRHTPNALRIILEGHGSYTTVEGTRVEMRPGDVLLTPSMMWHSHENVGNEDCYWVDILDVPLVHLLEPMFFERHPNRVEEDFVNAEESPIAFRWENTLKNLEVAGESGHPMAEREVQLGNPAMVSIALFVQQFGAGFVSACKKTTANQIFTVLEGSGKTYVDDQVFEWKKGDVIAVPGWRPYKHEVLESSYMVCATDAPLYAGLNLLREEIN